MSDEGHNYFFGQMNAPWKKDKEEKKMPSLEVDMRMLARYKAALRIAAEYAYEDEVVQPLMEDLIEETKEEWIDDRMQEWWEEAGQKQ